MSESYFTVTAKDSEKQAFMQKVIDRIAQSDEFRDMCHIPRVGREPDYLHGRWCVSCHNSLPDDWGIKPCDVCGGATGLNIHIEGFKASKWEHPQG